MTSIVALHDQIRAAIQESAAQLAQCAGDFERSLVAELEQATAVQEQLLAQVSELLAERTQFQQEREQWGTRQQGTQLELADERQQMELERALFDDAQADFEAQRQALEIERKNATREHEERIEALATESAELEARIAQEKHTAEEIARLQAHVAGLEAELTVSQETIGTREQELAAAHEQLTELAVSRAPQGNEDIAQLEQRCAEQKTQVVALQAELEASRVQAARLAAAAIDLADARAEILQLRDELDHSVSHATKELNNQITQLLRDRTELELELEAVRTRATELSEDAEEERRRTSEERSHWAGELRQLRRALEAQSLTLSEKEAALQAVQTSPSDHAVTMTPGSPTAGRSAKDPVLDAVMAQFQQLQKDRQQRRGVGGKGKQDVA